jgi:hypothetical protein
MKKIKQSTGMNFFLQYHPTGSRHFHPRLGKCNILSLLPEVDTSSKIGNPDNQHRLFFFI